MLFSQKPKFSINQTNQPTNTATRSLTKRRFTVLAWREKTVGQALIETSLWVMYPLSVIKPHVMPGETEAQRIELT